MPLLASEHPTSNNCLQPRQQGLGVRVLALMFDLDSKLLCIPYLSQTWRTGGSLCAPGAEALQEGFCVPSVETCGNVTLDLVLVCDFAGVYSKVRPRFQWPVLPDIATGSLMDTTLRLWQLPLSNCVDGSVASRRALFLRQRPLLRPHRVSGWHILGAAPSA